jgi:hypothetical protein
MTCCRSFNRTNVTGVIVVCRRITASPTSLAQALHVDALVAREVTMAAYSLPAKSSGWRNK